MRLILVCAIGLIACSGSANHTAWYHEAAQLTLAPMGQAPAWTVAAGGQVVLIAYKSGDGHADRNEELVVQLTPAELKAGVVDLGAAGRRVRYQEGHRTLSFATTHVRGRLTLERDGGALVASVDLVAYDPAIDREKRGTITRRFTFDATRRAVP